MADASLFGKGVRASARLERIGAHESAEFKAGDTRLNFVCMGHAHPQGATPAAQLALPPAACPCSRVRGRPLHTPAALLADVQRGLCSTTRRPVLSAEQFLQLLRQLQGWWVARDADEALLAMHPHACLSHFLDVPIGELAALTVGIFTKGVKSAARNAALGTHETQRVVPPGFEKRYTFLHLGASERTVQQQLALGSGAAPPRLRGRPSLTVAQLNAAAFPGASPLTSPPRPSRPLSPVVCPSARSPPPPPPPPPQAPPPPPVPPPPVSPPIAASSTVARTLPPAVVRAPPASPAPLDGLQQMLANKAAEQKLNEQKRASIDNDVERLFDNGVCINPLLRAAYG